MPDFSDETAVALRCHRVEPTIADVIERIVEGNWTYSIDLVYGADGPTHMATIQTRSIHRPKTLARSESPTLGRPPGLRGADSTGSERSCIAPRC